jgi:hypothetical protein
MFVVANVHNEFMCLESISLQHVVCIIIPANRNLCMHIVCCPCFIKSYSNKCCIFYNFNIKLYFRVPLQVVVLSLYIRTHSRERSLCSWWYDLCGLVVRVPGYRFRDSGFDSLAVPDFLRSDGSGTGSTQPREYN